MAKSKRTEQKKSSEEGRDFEIIGASIKEDICNYDFRVTKGVGIGDVHSVKGTGLIKDSLQNAFTQLNVHLACVDDVFKHSDVEIGDINSLHNDDLTYLYNVTGFVLKGGETVNAVILIGNKIITGTPEELEEGFFPAMRHPIDQVKGLQVQMDEFQKSANAVKDQAEKKKTPENKTEKKAEKKPTKKNEKPEPVQPDFFTQAENDASATEDGPKGEESNPADDQ